MEWKASANQNILPQWHMQQEEYLYSSISWEIFSSCMTTILVVYEGFGKNFNNCVKETIP
jgi:hypothetical protein